MEITISELAKETGLSIPHICMMIKRGTIPPGRKEGRATYLPAHEARLAIAGRTIRRRKTKIKFDNGSSIIMDSTDGEETRPEIPASRVLNWSDLI